MSATPSARRRRPLRGWLRLARRRLLPWRYNDPFRRDLETPSSPISLDLERDSDTLLIAFGGMRGLLGMPPFEFFNATGKIPVKRLFVRDLRQAWYHRGVPGFGATLDEFAASLLELVQRHDVRRLVMTGNSAGGYAALVFGRLLGADTVLCFAPQTVLDLDVLASWDDHRWDEQIVALVDAGTIDRGWLDLSVALPAVEPLPGAGRAETEYELYYDADFEIDRLHAERLADVPGMRLHPRAGGKHGLAREMRLSGDLDRVLQRALLGVAPPGSTASGAA